MLNISKNNTSSEFVSSSEEPSLSVTTESNTSLNTINKRFRIPNSTRFSHTKFFFCIFCKQRITRFARHLTTKHKNEKQVIEILRFPAKHKERNRLLNVIRNKGTFLYNNDNEYNKGDLIVVRRPSVSLKHKDKDYTPCPCCGAYYIAKNLSRHMNRCSVSKSKVAGNAKSLSRIIQNEMNYKHLKLDPNLNILLSSLKQDDISDTIKNDILLLNHASHLSKKYGVDSKLKHHSNQKLRQLARLLIIVKCEDDNIVDMKELLQPKHFSAIICGVQKLCGFNNKTGTYKIPSMANHLGMYLKECANILYAMCIKNQDSKRKRIVNDFKELMNLEYGASISRAARKDLEETKWNKPKLLPLISDIQLFRNHLVEKAEACCKYLNTKKFNHTKWRELMEVTAAIILTFNRKRPGETERIKLSSYIKKQSIDENSAEYSTLTTLEKLLCSSFKRIEIRGKLGRRVPVLLRKNYIRYIDTFLKFRDKANVHSNNQFLFGINKDNFIRLTDVMRKESICCGAEKPELLRATFLRKQVATTSQLLDLNDNEMQMLADFMGHNIEIHKAHYRTPELTLQIARLSKLLIAVDEGNVENYKDKSLKNIDVENYLDENERSNIESETDCDLGIQISLIFCFILLILYVLNSRHN